MGSSSGSKKNLINYWKSAAGRLKLETYTLYLAYKDPRVPWYAKFFTALIVGYGFSPIDLIPDFIPLIGYLDDLVIVPLGVILALKMIPQPVLEECREQATQQLQLGKPVNRIAAAVIILIWLLVFAFFIKIIIHWIQQ